MTMACNIDVDDGEKKLWKENQVHLRGAASLPNGSCGELWQLWPLVAVLGETGVVVLAFVNKQLSLILGKHNGNAIGEGQKVAPLRLLQQTNKHKGYHHSNSQYAQCIPNHSI